MNVLVTGGAGFIGSAFLRRMLARHPADRFVNLDLLTYAASREALEGLQGASNYRFQKGDIADRELVFALFAQENFDVVVNFAAESHVDRSIRDPSLFLRTNLLGTQVLLDAALHFGVSRFHQVSTDEVYGELPLESTAQFTEDTPLRPSSPYSASKAGADLLAFSYHRTYGLPVTVSRCTNNFGPYQHPEKLIPHAIQCAQNGQPVPVYGTGNHVRDWIFVEDHCSAIECILQNGQPGELYLISAEEPRDNLSLVREILRLLGKPETQLQFVADRPGHDLRYALSAEKLRRTLSWRPEHRFAESLRKTVEWYVENPWALKRPGGVSFTEKEGSGEHVLSDRDSASAL